MTAAQPNRATRRAAPKASPEPAALKAVPQPPSDLEIRVALLEAQLGETRWCFAELMHKAKAQREAAIRKALEDPNQREAIIAQISNQMD